MNLSSLTKPELVAMTKSIEGQAGDYARLPKEHYVSLLSAYNETTLTAALNAYRTEKKMPVYTAPEIKPESLTPFLEKKPASFTEMFPEQKPEPKASGDLEAAAELIRILKMSRGVNEDAVNALIQAALRENNVTVFESMSKVIEDFVKRTMDPVVHTVVVSGPTEHKIEAPVPPCFDKLVKLAGLRKNILLVGPAGCGKTTVAHLVATALGLPFASISCSAGMSEGQLLGRLLPIGEGGKFEYVASEFVKRYEEGGVFLIDELDASDENTLIVLNQALANGGFYLPSRTASPYCKRHPDFVCIAAANTFGHGADMVYAGRNKLDGATLDRFRSGIVVMDYDTKYEKARCAPEVLTWGYAIRSKIDSLRLRRIMSTRVLIDFSEQLAVGLTAKDWEASYFADWSKDELSRIGR